MLATWNPINPRFMFSTATRGYAGFLAKNLDYILISRVLHTWLLTCGCLLCPQYECIQQL